MAASEQWWVAIDGDRSIFYFFTGKNIPKPCEYYNPTCEMEIFWGEYWAKTNPKNTTFLKIFFQILYQIWESCLLSWECVFKPLTKHPIRNKTNWPLAKVTPRNHSGEIFILCNFPLVLFSKTSYVSF